MLLSRLTGLTSIFALAVAMSLTPGCETDAGSREGDDVAPRAPSDRSNPRDVDDLTPTDAEQTPSVSSDEGAEVGDDLPSTTPRDPLPDDVTSEEDSDALPPEAAAQQEPPRNTDACGAVPTTLTADRTGKRTGSSGYTEYQARTPNQLIGLRTKLTVPPTPPPSGTIFLWPGVQPLRGQNYLPIGNGVLQPVLTWGPSCAPGAPRGGYGSWWISAVYVNVSTTLPTHRGCHGGPVMRVMPKDVLDIEIVRVGAAWKQTVKNLTSGQSIDFTIDMKSQEQGRAIFDIELPTRNKPVSDVVFTETTLKYAAPLTRACTPATQGATDFISKARWSADKTTCCIDRIALRAQGVPATSTP